MKLIRRNKNGGIIRMNTNWLKVIVAAIFVVFWVIGLIHADEFLTLSGIVIVIIICFYLMIIAGRKLSVRTVYEIFVGLGVTRIIFTDILFFAEAFKISKFIRIFVLLYGIVGLSLVTKARDKE